MKAVKASAEGDIPVQVKIPALEVEAALDPVVTSSDGVLGIPQDPQRVGWWVGGALPGSGRGSVILAGHIDSAALGVGAFWKIDQLKAGDTIVVATVTGQSLPYRVHARRIYDKAAGLPSDLFTRSGPEQLLLISCGGPFNTATRSYQDNVAVFASPVPTPAGGSR